MSQARDYIGNQVKICTVAGFPNGYSTTGLLSVSRRRTREKRRREIDAVINIGWLKDKKYAELISEINEVKNELAGKSF